MPIPVDAGHVTNICCPSTINAFGIIGAYAISFNHTDISIEVYER
jgi:hypothetical protein